MDNDLEKIRGDIEFQQIRFKKGLGADLSFLILILLLIFVVVYTGIKDTGNPPAVQIILYVILYFFLMWDIYTIVKNSLGLWGLNKTEDLLGNIRETKSDAMKIPTYSFLSGFFYDLIDKKISNYVSPLQFHAKKKKENLISLNIRYVFWEFLVLSSGIAMFVAEVIYWKKADFHEWETILALVVMIVLILFTVAYLIPRQIIVNKQIKLSNKKNTTEEEYYDRYKYFYLEKVLNKFWNKE